MNSKNLEIAQLLKEHPVLKEKTAYKHRYLNVLEHFVRKYSQEDAWATATLKVYKEKFLDNPQDYIYEDVDLFQKAKPVLATKFKPFKFFTYRYCLIIDCIFINAIGDKSKSEAIYTELSGIYHQRYQKKIRQLFDALFDPSVSLDGLNQVSHMMNCWRQNVEFLLEPPIKVLVTANMSAGKSTLLNALVGKKVNKTQNDTCTAKIHYILNKPYEDGFSYEDDFLLDMNAGYATLMEDNIDNHSAEIVVGTFFRTVEKASKRIWLIDTPGVNSSQNVGHKELAEKAIIETNPDLLIYLLNGENIGTDDDKRHLRFILEHYQGEILFVVNKLDKFKQKEDSIPKTLESVVKELSDMGFKQPVVVPVSSYAGYLAKLRLFGDSLDEDELDMVDLLSLQMKRTEYQFNTYFPEFAQTNVLIKENDPSHQLLIHSGILHLENIIYNFRR